MDLRWMANPRPEARLILMLCLCGALLAALAVLELRAATRAAEVARAADPNEQRRLAREDRDHSRRDFAVGAALIILLGGAAAALAMGVRRQLSSRRRASEELRRTNLFLDATFESLPVMVFVKEARTLSFVRVNRTCEELVGMSRAQLLGKTDFDYFPPEQARFFQDKDRATLASGGVTDIVEEPIETARGRRWLHTRKVPLLDRDGTPIFLLGISEDITDRKREAEELRKAKEAAESTSRELEAFSYSVSHDLRAPLRAIDGFAKIVLDDNGPGLDQAGKDLLGRVRAAAHRMNELIDDLLELSRVSRHELRRERVNLSGLASVVIADLQKQSPGRAVEVEIDRDLTFDCDARLIRVALENLLGNAWKFTSKKPAAHIAFGCSEGAFFVRDDGAGFDMQYAGNLFGPFQRLHGKNEFEGNGIGLATVQRIVARHGGRIWAEGVPERGATFHFTLGAS
jgi:PAS domain S-box-containing protein